MIGWIIRRVGQAALVVLAMSLIVFVGLHAIGNPVDIPVSYTHLTLPTIYSV